ncbi:hypothetical protein ACM93F_004022 [Enterobacter ludwigii]|jgi:hypothetical protein|nr:hypothetical protein [Enterobacter asburiae]
MTNKLRAKWTIMLSFFLGGSLLFIIIGFSLKPGHRQILNCNFDAFMYDRQHKTMLNKKTHLYFYADGSGFRTESGFLDTDSGRKFMDRDIHFVFSDRDKDGTITLKYTQTERRIHDNAPDNVWGTESTPGTTYYLTVTEIGPKMYLFRERGTPLSICYAQDVN